ncbi:MAG: FAD-binding oxidoreductase [Candidatus Zixiibacteriota bacterium]|nr:MAG: FAD-binding oxidoreductase [candidate division Zixibacteria bacterium]
MGSGPPVYCLLPATYYPLCEMSITRELRNILGDSKVKDDPGTITAYSTDASIYKLIPRAVSFIEEEEDVPKLLDFAHRRNIPLTIRGGGTGLAGGAVGSGIVADFSKYNQILEVNPQKKWVKVQVGHIYEELNIHLKRHKLMFAPDPASGDACQIGGMLANNSSGPRTLRYGTTKDHVLEIEAYLASGQKILIKKYKLGEPETDKFFYNHPEFKKIVQLVEEKREEILRREVKVKKNSSGYDLPALAHGLDGGYLDLPRFFVGSEGTLAVFTSATLNLVEVPGEKVTLLVFFEDMGEIAHAVGELLPIELTSIEIVDSSSMDLIGRESYDLPPSSEAMLLIDLDYGDQREKVERIKEVLAKYRLSVPLVEESEVSKQEALWRARKAILPTLYRYDPLKKPLCFIEDAALPSEKLPEMLLFLKELMRDYDFKFGAFGHIGDGNLHVHALVNGNDPAQFSKIEPLTAAGYSKVIELGGTIAGEHGDGRTRAPFVERQFGPEVYKLFWEIKNLLDPEHILNPDVKLSNKKALVNLDYEKLNWDCSSCGKCNSYCPSYEAHREDSFGSRGRFRVISYSNYDFREARDILDDCLNCKSCRVICPAGCDPAEETIKRWAEHPPRILAPWLGAMKRPELLERIFSLQGRSQKLWDNNFFRPLVELLSPTSFRLRSEVKLPRLARVSIRNRHPELVERPETELAYFYGCADGSFDNNTGEAIITTLDKLGFNVTLPKQSCCGLPMETYGFMEMKTEVARFNIDSLLRFEHVVTGCGSCLLALKEYDKLFEEEDPYHQKAIELAGRCYDFSEFIIKKTKLSSLSSISNGKRVTYHDPCHLRAAEITEEPRQLLKAMLADRFVEMDYADRCCGFAGTYYFFHPEQSEKIFERKREALKDSGAEMVVSSCPTCLLQFKNQMGEEIEVRHPAELISEVV